MWNLFTRLAIEDRKKLPIKLKQFEFFPLERNKFLNVWIKSFSKKNVKEMPVIEMSLPVF